MNSALQFVQHALGAKYFDLSAEAVMAAKVFILDTIGVGVAGSNAPYTTEIRKVAAAWGEGGFAQVLGSKTRLPRASAAFVNGFRIHCQEFDCVHEPAVVHPMATIFAALLAESEGRNISGREFITAVCVAVDVAATLGMAATSGIRFFRPATAGIFGATLGAARLRRFNEAQALDAIGYALAFASGTMQAHVEGKPALPVQIGNAARGAVAACDIAAAGIRGPHDVFDGPFGYLTLFEESSDLESQLSSLGKIWRMTEVSHKPFPTGRAAQGGIVAVQQLRANGVTPENLNLLTLTAPPLIKRLVGRPYKEDMAVNYARLCFAYSGAVALLYGGVGLNDFAETRLRDKKVAAIARKINVLDDGSTNPAAFCPQIAIAELADGRTAKVRIEALYGAPGNPMTKYAQIKKFRACISFAGGEARAASDLINQVEQLESISDVGALAQLAAFGGS